MTISTLKSMRTSAHMTSTTRRSNHRELNLKLVLQILLAITCLIVILAPTHLAWAGSIESVSQTNPANDGQANDIAKDDANRQIATPSKDSESPALAPAPAPVNPISVDKKEAQNQQSSNLDQEEQQNANSRKARAESNDAGSASSSSATPQQDSETKKSTQSSSSDTTTKKPESTKTKSNNSPSKTQSSSKNSLQQQQQQQQHKSSSSKPPRLQANLGATASQANPSHYVSKNDAYSAIAEKHGALVHDAMRRSEKRRSGSGGHGVTNPFSVAGIQKAGALTDVINPFKTVTDSGLARTLGASMRSIMKSKYSVPAYVASALLGAVALMAFYESPISPLPVPPLPEAPAGRFPPEMPNLPPNTQVPFRYNQQQQVNQYQQGQQYNQRSYNPNQLGQAQQRQQQVLFPSQQTAQQRSQTNSALIGANVGSVGQIANNLLNVAKPLQMAQRKSGPDYEGTISKSIFSPILSSSSSSSSSSSASSRSSGAQSLNSKGQSSSGSGFLSYFGFGSSAQSPSSQVPSADVSPQSIMSGLQQQQQALVAQALGSMPGSSSLLEAKSSAPSSNSFMSSSSPSSSSSVSNIVNKFKSYFVSSPKSNANVNPSQGSESGDQVSRVNVVQAFIKDALPRLLPSSSNKKSSSSLSSSGNNANAQNSVVGQQSSSSSNQNQPSIYGNLIQNNNNNNQGLVAASRMQTRSEQSVKQSDKQNTGSGIMRFASALLQSFTSGVAQRNSIPSPGESSALKSEQDQSQMMQVASSLMSLMANLPNSASVSPSNNQASQSNMATDHQLAQSSSIISNSEVANNVASIESNQVKTASAAAAAVPTSGDHGHPSSISRSSEALDIVEVANDEQQLQPSFSQASSIINPSNQKQNASPLSPTSAQSNLAETQQQPQTATILVSSQDSSPSSSHVRKTRSIHANDGQIMSSLPDQKRSESATSPSRAAQMNAIVDYVSDTYAQNKMLINLVMNQVGLSQAVPYVEHLLAYDSDEARQ